MQGLPAPPDDVASLVNYWEVDGSPATTWHWLFVPALQSLDAGELRALWSALVLATVERLVPLMSAAGLLRACRLRRYGAAPFDVLDHVADNHGAGSGAKTMNAAFSIYWHTSARSRGGYALTRMPGLPTEFTDDQRTINELGWAEIGARATEWLNDLNATPSPAGGNCALVTLHRQRAGVPFVASVSAPIDSATPGARVATLRRRLNA